MIYQKKLRFLLITGFVVLLNARSFARPIAYQKIWSISGFHQHDVFEWDVTYSFNFRFSMTLEVDYDRMLGVNREFSILRTNFLLKRWDGEDYQGNVYLYLGGGAGFERGNTKGVVLAALDADYESRRFLFGAKASTILTRIVDRLTYYQLRAGIAPYRAKPDGFQTWLVLQSLYYPGTPENSFRIGPILRFFCRSVMIEGGINQHKDWLLNAQLSF